MHSQCRQKMVVGPGGSAKNTDIREEWWREAAHVQSQTLSEPGGVMEGAGGQPNTLNSREEWWRGPEGQPNAVRAERSCGGGQEGSQTHSEPEGVVEGYVTMTSSQ